MIETILAIIGGITIYVLYILFCAYFINNIDEIDAPNNRVKDVIDYIFLSIFGLLFLPYILFYYLFYPIWKPIKKIKDLESRIKKLENKRKYKK